MIFGMQNEQKSQSLKKVGECLYRNGIGTYFALIKVGGKQIKRSLKTDDGALAKRRLSDLRKKASRMHGKETRDVRFEELAGMWMQSIKGELKDSSHDRRRVALVGLTPFFKEMPLRSIGFKDVEAWKIGRGSSISARSHNIELETLKLIFAYAMRRGILLDNPADDFKRRKQAKTTVGIPSHAEFSQIVARLRASIQAVLSGAADMVEFLAYSGMRVAEAHEVRFRDINFPLSTLNVTGGETGTKNHEERTIPLFPSLKNLLLRLIEARGNANPDARIFTIASPRGALQLACRRAGVKAFCVHSLRHFFASNAIEKGINFATIAKWLGHSDGGILVAKTYGHLRNEFSADMALRMDFAAASPVAAIRSFAVLPKEHAA